MGNEKRQEKIQARMAQSRFLNLRDERPSLDRFLNALDGAFASWSLAAKGRLNRMRQDLHAAMDSASRELGACRDTLLAEIPAMKDPMAPGPEAVDQIVTRFEAQLQYLYVRVRASADRSLDQLAPRHRPILSLLEQLQVSYAKAAESIPATVLLIHESALPGRSLDGKTVFEKESEEILRFSCASGIPAICSLRFHLRLFALKRRYRVLRVPAGEIVAGRLHGKDTLALHPVVRSYPEVFEKARSRADDVWRGVRFNFQEAMSVLLQVREGAAAPEGEHEPGEEGAEKLGDLENLLRDLLTRAQDNLAAVEQIIAEFFDGVVDAAEKEHQRLRSGILRDIDAAGTVDSRLTYIQERVFRRGVLAARRFAELMSIGKEEGARSAGSVRSGLASLWKPVRRFLGISEPVPEVLLKLADLPSGSELTDSLRDFPPVYRGLFALGPLKSREFLVGRDEEMTSLADLLDRWRSELACSVAVIGPEGSGKTSLLNCFESEHGARVPFHRFEIDRRLRRKDDVMGLCAGWFGREEPFRTVEEVIEHILSMERSVLVVEGGHNLLLRAMGSQRAAEMFLYVILATREHMMWVVAFRENAWDRMDYLVGVSRYFTHQVRTLFHNQEDLKSAMLLRHHTSGYPLEFAAEGKGDGVAAQEGAGSAQEKKFFSDLLEASGGNFEAALFYWLLTLSYDPERQVFGMPPLGRLDYSFLRDMERRYQFTLAEVVCHGGMTIDEHGEIFQTDPMRSRLVLDYLLNLKLLDLEGAEGGGFPDMYVLNPAFYAPVTSTLRGLNILY